MKAMITVRVEKSNGTVVTKTQYIEPVWPYRESKAKFTERLEKAAASAVKAVTR